TARAKKGGKSPKLEVALYEYGNDGIPSGEGYIRMITPLTSDLDLVSEKLFALTTNGGSEYCGQVISAAARGLSWGKKNDQYRVIYIAGNEPFSQGQTEYKKACKGAIEKGIIVNTIYCGGRTDPDAAGWKDGAALSDGSFMNIDQNQRSADITAPQDAQLLKLNDELNGTYIAFGAGGYEKKERQSAQDSNSKMMANEAAIQRTMAKAAPAYSNSSWDIVDAQKSDPKAVDKIAESELPDEMKKMTADEKRAYVAEKQKQRETIQEKIRKLSSERQKFVEKEMKKQPQDNTLDGAIIRSIRSQAVTKGYRFE
ncbi:MAG: vWA domain-containing protein, partial [Spirochaetota bacterium]